MSDKVGISEVINEGGLDVYFRDMAAAETGECCTAGYIVKRENFNEAYNIRATSPTISTKIYSSKNDK